MLPLLDECYTVSERSECGVLPAHPTANGSQMGQGMAPALSSSVLRAPHAHSAHVGATQPDAPTLTTEARRRSVHYQLHRLRRGQHRPRQLALLITRLRVKMRALANVLIAVLRRTGQVDDLSAAYHTPRALARLEPQRPDGHVRPKHGPPPAPRPPAGRRRLVNRQV